MTRVPAPCRRWRSSASGWLPNGGPRKNSNPAGGILGGTTMAAQGAELRQPSCGRRFLASWGLSRAGRPCPWPASERADCLVAHYAGYFLPLLFLTTSARAPEKAPSENAWCFFVTSNSGNAWCFFCPLSAPLAAVRRRLQELLELAGSGPSAPPD
jgi:hypothetical protein